MTAGEGLLTHTLPLDLPRLPCLDADVIFWWPSSGATSLALSRVNLTPADGDHVLDLLFASHWQVVTHQNIPKSRPSSVYLGLLYILSIPQTPRGAPSGILVCQHRLTASGGSHRFTHLHAPPLEGWRTALCTMYHIG